MAWKVEIDPAAVRDLGKLDQQTARQKGESLLPTGVGLGRFWVLVDLFTGLVAPTTCSLITCLTTCMGDRFQRKTHVGGDRFQRKTHVGGDRFQRGKLP